MFRFNETSSGIVLQKFKNRN